MVMNFLEHIGQFISHKHPVIFLLANLEIEQKMAGRKSCKSMKLCCLYVHFVFVCIFILCFCVSRFRIFICFGTIMKNLINQNIRKTVSHGIWWVDRQLNLQIDSQKKTNVVLFGFEGLVLVFFVVNL